VLKDRLKRKRPRRPTKGEPPTHSRPTRAVKVPEPAVDLARFSERWRHQTVAELARKVGYGRQHLHMVLAGRRGASQELLYALADEFAITLDRLRELLPERKKGEAA
jgi:transcriptional regulator with XRE-family HTH domain